MNIYLMIKNTFRNKRFIFFTILTPVFWYIALVMMSKTSGFYKTKYAYICFTVSCLIGIAGNSLVLFAKSINSMKNFYELQIATSKYTILKWLYDEIIVQLVLNTIVCLVILIVTFLIVPFYTWVKSDWVSILTNVQRVSPGYYVNQLNQLFALSFQLS